MKDNRRNFLRKAALGSAAFSTGAGLSILDAGSTPLLADERATKAFQLPRWEISFDESLSRFLLKNDTVTIQGQMEFFSGDKKWMVTKSRDGVPDRYAIVDPQGNVQGYLVFIQGSGLLKLLFYHRTAQGYSGVLSYEGTLTFPSDGFACRTMPDPDERVLSLFNGQADSLLNDSVFAPETDAILQIDAADLQIKKINPGSFAFRMSGCIEESSEALFSFNLEKDYFKSRYVPYYHPIDRKRAPKAPTGWMSWNTYFDKATAEDNLAEARAGKKYLQPFGCEIWHIESWQENSDTLPVSKFYNMNLETSKRKFPKGMKKLAEDIKDLGFKPGLWVAPFGTGNNEFYNAHKEWFLHYKNGEPVSCWNGRYTLDPTVQEAREHLKKIFRTASHEWGYEYFKIDGMSGRSHGYCAHLYERPEIKECFSDPSCPNPFELCLRAFREGIGEDRIMLACQGHTSGPDALYADASRIGADIVHPNEPVKWTGVLNQGRCFMNQAFVHNIVTYADPDTLLVRDLSLEEARVSATVVALPGQLTFFGDKLFGLPEDRMKLLQQTLPPADIRPASLYPYFSMMPVWNLHVHNKILGAYNIVALFNWEDETRNIQFSALELGIESGDEYSLFEFWTHKDLGTMKGRFEMEVPAHCVRLLSIHKVKNVPHWVSSDRHITQNGMELNSFEWKDVTKMLEGEINLIGTFPLTMNIRVPDGFQFDRSECKGAKCSAKMVTDNISAITFISKATGSFAFRVFFKG
jgi:hypothetical protein